MKKILCNENGAVSKEDFNKLMSAVNVLGECIYKYPTAGYVGKDGVSYVYLDAMSTPREVAKAIQTIAPLFGLDVKIKQTEKP